MLGMQHASVDTGTTTSVEDDDRVLVRTCNIMRALGKTSRHLSNDNRTKISPVWAIPMQTNHNIISIYYTIFDKSMVSSVANGSISDKKVDFMLTHLDIRPTVLVSCQSINMET